MSRRRLRRGQVAADQRELLRGAMERDAAPREWRFRDAGGRRRAAAAYGTARFRGVELPDPGPRPRLAEDPRHGPVEYWVDDEGTLVVREATMGRYKQHLEEMEIEAARRAREASTVPGRGDARRAAAGEAARDREGAPIRAGDVIESEYGRGTVLGYSDGMPFIRVDQDGWRDHGHRAWRTRDTERPLVDRVASPQMWTVVGRADVLQYEATAVETSGPLAQLDHEVDAVRALAR